MDEITKKLLSSCIDALDFAEDWFPDALPESETAELRERLDRVQATIDEIRGIKKMIKYEGVVRLYKGDVMDDIVAFEQGFSVCSNKPLTNEDIVGAIKELNFEELDQ